MDIKIHTRWVLQIIAIYRMASAFRARTESLLQANLRNGGIVMVCGFDITQQLTLSIHKQTQWFSLQISYDNVNNTYGTE